MFYDNFVRLCNKINKTPTAVAIEIGKSKATAHKWKNGAVPHNSTLRKIADYFNISVDDLLKDAEKPSTQEGEGLSDDAMEFATLFDRAEPWLQDQIRSLLRAAESARATQDDDSTE